MTTGVRVAVSSVETSAILQADSVTQGILVPRMTTAQRDAIASPATGLLVFNTDDAQHQQYNGASWGALGGSTGPSITSGAYVDLPATGTVSGDTYHCNDSRYTLVWDGTSGSWAPYYGSIPVTLPPTTGWSWDNQGSAWIDTSRGFIAIGEDVQGNVVAHRVRYRTAPSPPYTITALLHMNLIPYNYRQAGLMFRQSSDGALVSFRAIWNGAWRLNVAKHADSSTDTASYIDISAGGWAWGAGGVWMRIEDDNTDRVCSLSVDGAYFHEVHRVTRTDYLTADEVGFFASARDATSCDGGASMSLVSWREA